MFKRALITSIILLSGCGVLKPDSFETGYMNREIRGRWKIFDLDRTVPFFRLRGNYSLCEKVDEFIKVDLTEGEIGSSQYRVRGHVEGNMQSLGAGLRYKPLCDKFSLDFGVECFHTGFDVDGQFGFIKHGFHDSTWGYGFNAGISG